MIISEYKMTGKVEKHNNNTSNTASSKTFRINYCYWILVAGSGTKLENFEH